MYKGGNENGSIIIFHLSRLRTAKFFILFWWGCRGNLKLINLASKRVKLGNKAFHLNFVCEDLSSELGGFLIGNAHVPAAEHFVRVRVGVLAALPNVVLLEYAGGAVNEEEQRGTWKWIFHDTWLRLTATNSNKLGFLFSFDYLLNHFQQHGLHY